MTNVPLNPRQFRDTPRYVANNHRIEFDRIRSTTIDYDFFESESKGVSSQKTKLVQKKTLITEKVQTRVADENVSKLMQRKMRDFAKENNVDKINLMSSDTSQDIKGVFSCGNNDKETQTTEFLEKKTITRAVQTEKVKSPTRRKSVPQIVATQKTVNALASDKLTNCMPCSSHDKPAPLDASSPETGTKTNNVETTTGMNEENNSNVPAQLESDETMTKEEHTPKQLGLNKDADLSVTNGLTNCIAYLSEDDGGIRNVDGDLMSSDTTSDITTVTSRAGSSEYSMMVSACSTNEQKNTRQNRGDNEPSLQIQVHAVGNGNLGAGEYQRLTTNSTPSFKSSSTGRMPPVNMSFPRTKVLEIERENRCLLRKINDNKNFHRKPTIMAPNLNLSSAAINRRNKNMEIHWENQRFLRKLNAIKAATNTSSW